MNKSVMNFNSLSKISRNMLFTILTPLASLQLAAAAEADQDRLVSANNSFAFDLTAEVAKDQTEYKYLHFALQCFKRVADG